MIADAIGTDTQAVLLLTAPLGKRGEQAVKPLTPSEYALFAEALRKVSLRPAGLLNRDGVSLIAKVLAEVAPGKAKQIDIDRIERLLGRGGLLSLALRRWIDAGLWVVSRADARYPSRYKRALKNSAPPIVFGIGPQELLEGGGVAVVGSRKPEPSSAAYAQAAGRWAAATGMQVVSGAARGVDELAMLACAEAGGASLGVVAESLLRQSMSRQFRDLLHTKRLALISSFDPDAPFSVGNAMARNRWIYALADRGLVVACSEKSGGTWAGAVQALQHDFPVYVRRGNPDRPGNEALIALGGMPIDDDFSTLFRNGVSLLRTVELAVPEASLKRKEALPVDTAQQIYTASAPILLHMLERPSTAKEVMTASGLPKTLVDRWLKRLVEDGHAVKDKSRYRAVQNSGGLNQPSLFS